MSTTYSIPTYARVHSGDTEVIRVDRGEYTYLASLRSDEEGREFDGCGVLIVEVDATAYGDGTLKARTNCGTRGCCNELEKLGERLERAWSNASDHIPGFSWDDPLKVTGGAFLKVLERAGASAASLSVTHYEWEARKIEDTADLRRGVRYDWRDNRRIVVTLGLGDDADYTARICAAEMNGKMWAVGKMLTEDLEEMRVDDDDMPEPHWCDEVVHGVIWRKIDSDGDNRPTDDELVAYGDWM